MLVYRLNIIKPLNEYVQKFKEDYHKFADKVKDYYDDIHNLLKKKFEEELDAKKLFSSSLNVIPNIMPFFLKVPVSVIVSYLQAKIEDEDEDELKNEIKKEIQKLKNNNLDKNDLRNIFNKHKELFNDLEKFANAKEYNEPFDLKQEFMNDLRKNLNN